MDLAIDHPQWLHRSWDGNRARCWLRPLATAEVAVSEDLRLIGLESPAPAETVVRPHSAVAVALRLWRHRIPRPDSAGLVLLLRPLADDQARLLLPVLDEAAHKPTSELLREGLAAGIAEAAGFPVAGCEWVVTQFADDGPSSAEGLRMLAELASAALLVEARRQGAVSFL